MATKNYRSRLTDWWSLGTRFNEAVTDIDARLDRLEQAQATTTAQTPTGELAEETKLTFPTTKIGMRKKIVDLTDANIRLARAHNELTESYIARGQEIDRLTVELADAKDAYWKEKIDRANERLDWNARMRQFVKETTGT